MTEQHIKARDIPPTAVRLAPELRHALAREAAINGRSLHAEIVLRLRDSLAQTQTATGAMSTGEPIGARYLEHSDSERALLTMFRRLSPEKQLALLSLLN